MTRHGAHSKQRLLSGNKKALEMQGIQADKEGKYVTVGFARNAVLSVADKIIEAVKSGCIKRLFLVGGCDGAKPGRSYYTEFVEKAPQTRSC